MNTALLVSIVAILGSLVLAWRSLRARRLEAGLLSRMALIWAVIIVAVVLLAKILDLGVAR